MTRHGRLRRPPPPPFWSHLCVDWLGLSWMQRVRWWDALRRAQWSRAVELRTALLCDDVLGQTPAVLEHLVRHTVNPRVLISTVEDLVREGGRLTRAQANRVEEAILWHTTAAGN